MKEYRTIFRPPLVRALAVSLVLHGFVLAPTPWPRLRLVFSPAPGLRADLVPSVAKTATGRVRGGGKASAAPSVPRSGVAAGVGPGSRTRAAGEIGTGPLSAPGPAEEAVRSGTRNAEEEGVAADADSVRGYLMAVARQSRRLWRYPDAARRAGMTGTVVLRLSWVPGGPLSVVLDTSSGHAVLDEAALALVREAALGAERPLLLRERSLSLLLPVSFSLP